MVVRCTKKMLDLLGGRSITLSKLPPTDEDWYLNLLWIDRQKCVLAHPRRHVVLRLPGRCSQRGSPPARRLPRRGHRNRAPRGEPAYRHLLRASARECAARQDREPQHTRLHERNGLRTSIPHR